ncbi:hypothetical protein Taro_038414 [Colocasia esculenta]|uniref:Uncharacterized protein n=1 Tax=Colocasia esculenta TaxID=4460 RepID=A0A843W6L8_COLES|nr:hypothetical protein [Colocasia esculenta]
MAHRVVLVGLHSCLTCSRGAAVGPFVRDYETEMLFLCCVVWVGYWPDQPVVSSRMVASFFPTRALPALVVAFVTYRLRLYLIKKSFSSLPMAAPMISGSVGGYSAEFMSPKEQERFTFVKTKICGNKAVDVHNLEKSGMSSLVEALRRMQWLDVVTFTKEKRLLEISQKFKSKQQQQQQKKQQQQSKQQ